MDIISLGAAKTYTSQRAQELELRLAQVNKELKDYQRTLAQMNPNQEPKQTVSDYKTVGLPKNAASGQMSISLKGMTLKNELNYTPETWEEWDGDGIIDKDSSGLTIGGASKFVYVVPSAKTSTKYGVLLNIVSNDLESNLMALTSIMSSTVMVRPGELGNKKIVFMSIAEFVNTRFGFYTQSDEIGNIKLRDIRMFELPAGSEIESDFESLTADELAMKYPYIRGDSAKSTQATCRLKAVDAEGENPTYQYITAIDAEGEPIELRSLPNGVADTVEDGKFERNTAHLILDSVTVSADTIRQIAFGSTATRVDFGNLVRPEPYGNWAISDTTPPFYDDRLVAMWSGQRIRMSGYTVIRDSTEMLFGFEEAAKVPLLGIPHDVSGWSAPPSKQQILDFLDTNPIILTYQLAEPITIPAQVSGTLLSQPSGTVYWEKATPDAGIYNNGVSVLIQDLPIASLEKLSKVDYETGLETDIDASQAVIAGDGLSFTHPDLADGDIVFFVYYYDVDSTVAKLTAEFYDSRYVKESNVTPGKFYKLVVELDENDNPILAKEEV
jgi:hypothetical protein